MKNMIACFIGAVVFGAGLASAADPIKVELKTFKWKAAFDGGAELGGFSEDDSRLFYYVNGTMTAEVKVAEDGEYTLVIDASCTPANKMFAHFKLTVGETEVAKEHKCTTEESKKYEFPVKLKKGDTKIAIQYLNDTYKENEYDLNLFIHGVELKKK